MMRSATPPRDWIRKRLVPYEAGLLSKEEEARFLELVEHDEGCRELWETFALSLPAEDFPLAHPPLSLIREGLEREELSAASLGLVRSHIRSCGACRESARREGIDLTALLALESTRREAVRDDRSARSFLARLFTPGGLTVGWATAATIATLVLLIGKRSDLDLMNGGAIGLVTRSGGIPTIPSGPDGFYLSLNPPLDLPPDTVAEISILDSSGELIVRREGTLRELCRPNLIVVSLDKGAKEATYTFVLQPAGGAETRFPFKTVSSSSADPVRTP
jgi:hypothetical protein